MAVVSVRELIRGREGEQDNKRQRRYTRTFRVTCSTPKDGPSVVMAAASVPSVYGAYSSGNDSDSGALAERISVKEDGFCQWIAEVTYSTFTPDPAQNEDDPTNRAPVMRWSSALYQVPVVEALDGTPIVNSAGDPFDPPIERDDKRMVLSYERYETTYSPALSVDYACAVNEDPFLGFAAGLARCNSIEAERHYEKGEWLWKVRYEFEFRREGWRARPLDQGFRYLDAAFKPQLIRDDKSSPVSSPALLTGDGLRLSEAKTTLTAPGCDAVQTFIAVDSTAKFGPAPFVVKIDSEYVLVQGFDAGPPLALDPVVRGYRNSTAAAHAGGVTAQQQPTYLEFQIYRELPFEPLNIV